MNFLFLDYAKGDVAGDKRFVDVVNARVYTLPEQTIPINPFVLSSYYCTNIRFSAEEKVESISSYDNLGPVQKGLLSRAIEAAYEERAGEDQPYPDFEIVERRLLQLYEEEGKSEDTLTETMREAPRASTCFPRFQNLVCSAKPYSSKPLSSTSTFCQRCVNL